ncbi:MAG: polysaccharide deacetylase family protein [Patescibacteria group bacterium]|nr:polysaccharide deacetylase family protein [Patescibacteria group bacterium]
MPIWFTMDLDVEFDNERFGKPYGDKNPGVEKGIPLFLSIFKKFQVPATFHIQEQADVSASISLKYPQILEAIIKEPNHEIGLHIHFERGYDFDSREREIASGIRRLEEKYGKIVSFRAGKYFTNEDTIKILEKYGIKYDVSPYKNTSIGNKRWYDIPDSPYHPNYKDITKVGEAKILIIPIINKRLGIFVDNSIPLKLMKKGTNVLISESRKIEQPIIIFLSTHSWKCIDPKTDGFQRGYNSAF